MPLPPKIEPPKIDPLSFDKAPDFTSVTANSIVTETKLILGNTIALHDHLATTLLSSTATFQNLIRPIIDDQNIANCRLVILGYLLARNALDSAVRDASREAQKLIAEAQAKALLRQDIAALVEAVYERHCGSQQSGEDKDEEQLDDQDRHLLSRLYGKYKRSGAGIQDEDARARFVAAGKEVNEILTAAQEGFTENSNGLWFTRAELAGTPERWQANLKVEKADDDENGNDDDRLWVTFRDDHFTQVQRSAVKSETRRKLFLAKQWRFPENIARLSRLICLRDEMARLLGYRHHADLKMEERMARSVESLNASFKVLREKLYPLAWKEVEVLTDLKRKHVPEDASSGKIYPWDATYYANVLAKEAYAVNHTKVAEYFEVMHTLRGMLKVFERLFSLKFQRMDKGASVWHESVIPCTVWDSDDEGGSFLGYLYLDVFARPGKFSQQYNMPFQKSFLEADGKRHYAACALVCSYPSSTPDKPSLLQHRDVKILFHELGHSIHHLVQKTKYAISSAGDYTEIPSNMLEHFIWIPEVLIQLGRHFSYSPKEGDNDDVSLWLEKGDGVNIPEEAKLPRSLAEDISRTKMLNYANALLSLLQRSVFDLSLYTPASHQEVTELDTTTLWNSTKREILPYSFDDEDDPGHGQAGFTMAFRTMDVAFFSYLLSKVYAADLFESGFESDPLSPEAGKRWRHSVLEKGSRQPEMNTLEEFLGRKLSYDAVFRQIELAG